MPNFQYSKNSISASNVSPYDLEERTTNFAENLIEFCKQIRITDLNNNTIKQLLKSGTSIGANYCEANNASSKKDFRNKIYICKKEASETKFWLRILAKSNPEQINKIRILWKETHELNLIFQKIVNTTNTTK